MEVKHTPLPWKMVSDPHFDSGLVYTSIQPVNVDEEAMKPLAMANGEHHVCRMSHTAAEWRFSYHRENAAFIVRACNSHYELLDALRDLLDAYSKPDSRLCCDGRDCGCMGSTVHQQAEHYARLAIAKAEGRP